MRKLTLSAVALVAAAGLALTGCSSGSLSGGDETKGSDGGSGDLTKVTVGLLPIAPAAAVQFGIDEGVFEKHGLDVDVQIGQGGAALLPAVSSGTIQFAVGNPLSVLVASSQGLGMNIIAGYSAITDPAPSGIVVAADSGIASWKDLEGKTVAVNAINTQGDLSTKGVVEADGGDPSKVEFTEIAFPDQLAQLQQGNIDAAWIPEPFLSAALETDGVQWLGDPLTIIPDLYTMVTFTSSSYAEANPEVVEQFAAAISESTELAMTDDAGYRAAIVDFTGMDAAVVEKIRLEKLSGTLDRGIIEDLSALALKYGFLKSEPDLDQVIWQK